MVALPLFVYYGMYSLVQNVILGCFSIDAWERDTTPTDIQLVAAADADAAVGDNRRVVAQTREPELAGQRREPELAEQTPAARARVADSVVVVVVVVVVVPDIPGEQEHHTEKGTTAAAAAAADAVAPSSTTDKMRAVGEGLPDRPHGD